MAPLSFHNLPALPMEIVLLILYFWMGPQNIKVIDTTLVDNLKQKTPGIDRLLITYDCESEKLAGLALPPILLTEFQRLRRHSWLKDTKYFNNPYDFYWTHSVLFNVPTRFPALVPSPHSRPLTWNLSITNGTPGRSPSPLSPSLSRPPTPNLPTTQTSYPQRRTTIKKHFQIAISPLILLPPPVYMPTHGLERITLDFTATQLFAFFDVRVPPFHRVPVDPDHYLFNAAIFLQHCTHLTLVFGEKYRASHPWSDLGDEVWCDSARLRPRVCDLGQLVDVVLEAAWGGGFVQNLNELVIEGDVQSWVRMKWHLIMRDWAGVREKGGSWMDVHRPQVIGAAKHEEKDMEKWPPECMCAKKCWRVGCEVIVPIIEWPVQAIEGVVGTWDEGREEMDICWD